MMSLVSEKDVFSICMLCFDLRPRVSVLSDSEDDDVVQAIRASIKESNQPTSTTAPLSPAPHDNSIIILDDDSPPRPAPAPVQNKVGSSAVVCLFIRCRGK